MYKVLIVDDEPLVRNFLATLINWNSYGFVIVGDAMDGEEAMNMVDQLKPHIVLLDMNMPDMTGVEVCQWIYSHHSAIKTVVLSSYDSFDYVRETMKCGAMDYLLKHELHPRKLLEVLDRVRAAIEQTTTDLKRHEQLEKNWEVVSTRVANNYLRELVLGMEEPLEAVEEHLSKSLQSDLKNIMITVMQVVNYSIITEGYSEKERNVYFRSIHDLCKQSLSNGGKSIVAYMDEGKFVMMRCFPEERSEAAILQSLDNDLKRIENTLCNFLSIRVVFGISAAGQQLTQVPLQYKAASRMLEERLLLQFTGGKGAGDHHKHIDPELSISLKQERELLEAMNLLSRNHVHAIVDEILSSSEMLHIKNIQALQGKVRELVMIANKVWRKSGLREIKETASRKSDVLMEQLNLCTTAEGMRAWVKDYYDLLLNEMSQHTTQENSPYVVQAKKYVREHYSDNISLELAAKSIGITPSYLGRLFKEEMNLSFTEYVNQLRVDMSKQLFEKGLSIKNIYEAVGFSSYNYFFKVFKDMEGVTPQTYVKQKMKSESGKGK